jgi:predicted metallopeptidase
MTGHRNGRRPPGGWVTERHWDAAIRPLPRRWVLPETARARLPRPATPNRPFNFCTAMRRLCRDVAARCPAFAHIDLDRVLVSFTPSRNASPYGLQARVTPMRFRDGATARRFRGVTYRVQRYVVDGREVLYVITFCLPRFLDQSFDEKLVTVFHELYHLSPEFNGDLRRHPGRYAVHSHSKREYDARMGELVRDYLADHPAPELFEFLRHGYADLWNQHGGVVGVVVPRPKLLPVAVAVPREEMMAVPRRGKKGRD